MASQAELEQVRRALNRLSQAAAADWRDIWESLRASDRKFVGDALDQGWAWVLERYGNMAATLAADFFVVEAGKLNLTRPRTVMAPAQNAPRAAARLGWAMATGDRLGNSLVLLDELVKQPYRSTIQDSAIASGAGWARVPVGTETCAFCLMLAGRGAVYSSAEAAGQGKRYHGSCDCTPTLVRDDRDFPEGYDPTAISDLYHAARLQADGVSTSAILAAMRHITGGN